MSLPQARLERLDREEAVLSKMREFPGFAFRVDSWIEMVRGGMNWRRAASDAHLKVSAAKTLLGIDDIRERLGGRAPEIDAEPVRSVPAPWLVPDERPFVDTLPPLAPRAVAPPQRMPGFQIVPNEPVVPVTAEAGYRLSIDPTTLRAGWQGPLTEFNLAERAAIGRPPPGPRNRIRRRG